MAPVQVLGGHSLPGPLLGLGHSRSVSKTLTTKHCQSTAGQTVAIQPTATGNASQCQTLSKNSTELAFAATT